MTASVTIERSGPGVAQLWRRSKAVDGKIMKVGVQARGGGPAPEFFARKYGERAPSIPTGVTVAQIAAFHEFGAGVPERPFFRTYLAGGGKRAMGRAARDGVYGFLFQDRSVTYMLEQPGKEAEIGIRESILSRIPPPLSQATTDDPGRDPAGIPLYDTQQIYNNIVWAKG